ncbi:MAG: hypothetical protein EOO40_05115 [Deltaproteobacteria bacterium]|nr:MAG: hypothetical protein EOO40_05115 [Deltaproteobacteria bacterium]
MPRGKIRIQSQGRPLRSACKTPGLCRKIELTPSSVAAWVRQAKFAGDCQNGELSNAERRELAALRKKLREVEVEQGVRRKTTVWFAK